MTRSTWQNSIETPFPEHAFRYAFLGYTESNLKSGIILFFREGEDFTVEKLKEHFGSDLRTVYEEFGYGKYAARLGLSFSSSVATQKVHTFAKIIS